jgi:hypothetical protein
MHRLGAVGSVVGVLLLTACGRGQPAVTQDPGAPVTAATVASAVYEIAAGSDGSTLWFAEFDGVRVVLHQFDTATGRDTPHALGASSASGIGAHVRQGPDGAIWVSDDYAVFRYDPTRDLASRITLPLRVPGALSGALDPSDPLPGTWVSALAFDTEGDLLLARNHVPYLQVLSPAGRIVGRVTLPEGYDGLSDLMKQGKDLLALAGHTHTDELGIAPVDTKVGGVASVAGQLRAAIGGSLRVFFADGGSVTSGDGQPTTWKRADGTELPLPLPSRQLDITNPLGDPMNVTVRDDVTAAVQVGDALWYVEQTSRGYALKHLS